MSTYELTPPQENPDLNSWGDHQGDPSMDYFFDQNEDFDFSPNESYEDWSSVEAEDFYNDSSAVDANEKETLSPFQKELLEEGEMINSNSSRTIPTGGSPSKDAIFAEKSNSNVAPKSTGKDTSVQTPKAQRANASTNASANASSKSFSSTNGRVNSQAPQMPESQYARTYEVEYDYEPKDDRLLSVKNTYAANGSQQKSNRGKSQTQLRQPLSHIPTMLNINDFADVDEYVLLAERPVVDDSKLLKKGGKSYRNSWYESPKEPIEFIGKLTKVQPLLLESGHAQVYYFIGLDLKKYSLIAFKKKSGQYNTSYGQNDITHPEIGSYWLCNCDFSRSSKKITWHTAQEMKNISLNDIFKNPDPKFRPKGWCILNDQIIFDPKVIEGKQIQNLEEFQVQVEPGLTTRYYGTVNGMLI